MESELENLHLTSSDRDEATMFTASNPGSVRIRRESNNMSRTNSNISISGPPSPTVSEHSLIFERSVENLSAFPSSNNISVSTTNLTMLSKERSNSNVFLPRQLTGGSSNSIASSTVPSSISKTNSRNSISHPVFKNTYVNQSQCQNTNHHHRRRTIENLVAPDLDASCSLIADSDTNMNNFNMIHSRNSSIVGLNMALGLSRSPSVSGSSKKQFENNNGDDEYDTISDSEFSPNIMSPKITTNSESTYTSPSFSSSRNSAINDPNKVLRFYSYVDMVSDEQINPAIASRRPSFISNSFSSPLLKPSELLNSNSSTSPTHINTGFLKASSSSAKRDQSSYLSPPLVSRRYSGNNINNSILSRSPTYTPNTSNNRRYSSNNTKQNKKADSSNSQPKFHLESSDEFSSDDESETFFDLDQSNNDQNHNINYLNQQNTKIIPSILKTSMFQTDDSNSSSDIYRSKSRTSSNTSHSVPHISRQGNASSGKLRNLSIPNGSNNIGGTSPVSPSTLQVENLDQVLRQK